MKGDRIAEAQFNEFAKFDSVGDTLGNTSDYLKVAAEKILCT